MNKPHTGASESTALEVPSALLHEMRTPLTHIIGFSELLIEQTPEQGDQNATADLEKIRVAGKGLLALIEHNFHSNRFCDPPAATAPSNARFPSASSAHPISEASGENAEAQGSVLVVDDIEANRDVLCRHLKRQGYTVASCESGKDALEMLESGTYDVVLLDVMMPEMDGYEVLQRLKGDQSLGHIPVIMISALGEIDSVVRCIAMGAEDYLPKPFEPTLLKARIGTCLQRKRAHDREQRLGAALRAQNAEMAAWRKLQEADLALARTTQQGIVNAAQPPLAGWNVETIYRPLMQVGGDVHGWRAMDHGSCLYWVADATGHGVAAALFTTLAALLFNHASTLSGTAHGVLTRVNAEFYTLFCGRSLMTACCAVVHPNGRLSFAGAGHPPLLIRRQNGSVEALPSLVPMLGLRPEAEIDPTVTTLAPGDTALLYTDGLYSSKADTGERLTAEALADAFARLGASADFLPSLVAELDHTSSDHCFDDDVAAIALRRE